MASGLDNTGSLSPTASPICEHDERRAPTAPLSRAPTTDFQIADAAILQPLAFPELPKKDFSCFLWESVDVPIPCLVCDVCFSGGKARTSVLQHLLIAHKVVVHKTSDICCFKRYMHVWIIRHRNVSPLLIRV